MISAIVWYTTDGMYALHGQSRSATGVVWRISVKKQEYKEKEKPDKCICTLSGFLCALVCRKAVSGRFFSCPF